MFGMFFLLTVIRSSGKSSLSIKNNQKLTKVDHELVPVSEQVKLLDDSKKIFEDLQFVDDGILGSSKLIKNVIFKLE